MSARTREIDLATGLTAVLVLGAIALAGLYGWHTPPGVVPTFRWEAVQLATETVCFSVAAVAMITRQAGRSVAAVLLFRGVCMLLWLSMLALLSWHGGQVVMVVLVLGLAGSNWISLTMALWLPDGRLPGPGWRWWVGFVGGFALVDVVLSSTTASTVYGVPNPWFGWLRGTWLQPVAEAYAPTVGYVVLAFVLVGGLSVVFRWRRMSRVQRRQAALLFPMYVLWEGQCVLWAFGVLSGAARFSLAYAMTVLWPAVLVTVLARDRVSRLDLAARRALVVAVLAVPVGVAVAFLPAEASVVAVLASLAGTLLVPLSRWVSGGVDRLIYGRRATPYAAARSLTSRLRDSLAPGEVPAVICSLVVEVLRFPFAALEAGERRLAAAGVAGVEPVVFELRHQGEAVGRLLVEPRQEWGGVDDADLAILQSLADQAAVAVQLSERAVELAASRARIVQAGDSARRRLERRLHDGIQQELVALVARLRLVRNQARRGSSVDEELTGIQDDAYRIIDGLRELAHGIHPPVLTDRGLLAAVESAARRLPIAITVEADPELGRFAVAVEESAFFLVSEALTNVLKHAEARTVRVRLVVVEGSLEIEVADDGVGCADGYRGGSGLTEMRDRVDTVGGRLVISPGLVGGTMVRAVVPLRETTNA